MTTRVSMNQVIHAAVRRDLGRLDDALGAVADGDVERAGALQRAYANLHRELQHHHHGEDDLIFPFVVAKVAPDPELLRSMDDEHHAMAEALVETSAAMEAYASTGTARDAQSARDSVARTRDVVERHLTHEENDVEPLIWPHMETKEWKAVEKQLRPKSLGETGSFFAWLQDGMTDEHRQALRSTVPPPVTFLLGRLAGRAYRRDVASAWTS